MDEDIRERVLRLLTESPFIEGHNDAPIQLLERSDNDLNTFDLNSFDFEDTTASTPVAHSHARGEAPGTFSIGATRARERLGELADQRWWQSPPPSVPSIQTPLSRARTASTGPADAAFL